MARVIARRRHGQAGSKTTPGVSTELALMVKILQVAENRIDTALPCIRHAATALRPLAHCAPSKRPIAKSARVPVAAVQYFAGGCRGTLRRILGCFLPQYVGID